MARKAIWAAESKLSGLRNAGLPFLVKELREAGGKARDWARGKRGTEPTTAPGPSTSANGHSGE
jgi:hypothetical protein